ncbi:hypothetical protein [Parabacteroides pacaensis]|uniref:hypothetical protein n=1 Tax=Parabacteroides pacaensis TaxID=2086575 RepID=UPI000D102F5D|nr:hypothetical protein [Parabacteroides pacaensis]
MLVDLTKIQLHYLEFLVTNEVKNEPEYINQEQAYRRFKRCNVDRWVKNGVVKRHLRPKNIEFNLNELRKAAANRQDYLIL